MSMKNNKKNATGSRGNNGSQKNSESCLSIPAAYSMSSRSSKPRVNMSNKFSVTRREFVGTATNGSTTGFAVTPQSAAVPGYDLNPGASTMFPWLSQIAGAFERFRFTKVSFEFIPGQSTATAGRFYAAVDYDYDDAVATTKTGLMGNMTAVESSLWQPCELTCDPSALNRDMPYRYVSCTTRGLSVELRTANSGFLMVAFDTAVTNCLMDIWVTYSIEFVTPVNDEDIVEDLALSGTSPTTNLTAAHGTAFAGTMVPYWIGQPSGPVRVVTSGVGNTPVLNGYLFTQAITSGYGLDVRSTKSKGVLTAKAKFTETGVTPATDLAAGVAADVYWQAMDSFGNYLGSLSTGYTRTTGCASGDLATAGGLISSITSIPLQKLFDAFPTVKYIAPFIVSLAALGAGSRVFGFEYSD